jgi:hypothetical protein
LAVTWSPIHPNRDHSEAQLHESHALIVLLTLYSMFPDPTSRQPYTAAAFLPLFTCHYVLAVLAILPHTFILKLALLPVILWQAWNCAVGLDLSAGVANSLGLESSGRVRHLNFAFVVRFLVTHIVPPPFLARFLLAC